MSTSSFAQTAQQPSPIPRQGTVLAAARKAAAIQRLVARGKRTPSWGLAALRKSYARGN